MLVKRQKAGLMILLAISFAFLCLVEPHDFSFAQSSGSLVTVAGTGTAGFSGDGGPATMAQINGPEGIAIDSVGNLYIADTRNHCIRKVTLDGIISTVAGNGTKGFSGDGGPATSAQLYSPTDAAVDSSGNLYIADFNNNRIRRVTPEGVINTVAGGGTLDPGDGGPATSSILNGPNRIALDSAENLYITDGGNLGFVEFTSRVQKVTPDGVINTLAGGGTESPGDGGPATSVQLYDARGIAIDSEGNLYIAEDGNNRIRKVSTDGTISTVAGNGTEGYSGDGGLATSAQLSWPYSISVDPQGNLYFEEWGNNCIRKVSTDGIISTVLANLNDPMDIELGPEGSLYIAERDGNRILKAQIGSPTYFPEIISGLGWSTLFTISNTGLTEASGVLDFTDPDGNPLELNAELTDSTGITLPANPASTFTFTIPAGGTIFLSIASSDNQDEFQTGWAKLQGTGGRLSGTATYEFAYNAYPELFFSVPSSPLLQMASIPFHNDDAIGKQTAYVIANPGSAPVSVNLVLVDQAGRTVDDSFVFEIGPGQQIAGYLFQDLACLKFRGSVIFNSANGQPFVISALVEKQGLFTAIPATAAE